MRHGWKTQTTSQHTRAVVWQSQLRQTQHLRLPDKGSHLSNTTCLSHLSTTNDWDPWHYTQHTKQRRPYSTISFREVVTPNLCCNTKRFSHQRLFGSGLRSLVSFSWASFMMTSLLEFEQISAIGRSERVRPATDPTLRHAVFENGLRRVGPGPQEERVWKEVVRHSASGGPGSDRELPHQRQAAAYEWQTWRLASSLEAPHKSTKCSSAKLREAGPDPFRRDFLGEHPTTRTGASPNFLTLSQLVPRTARTIWQNCPSFCHPISGFTC